MSAGAAAPPPAGGRDEAQPPLSAADLLSDFERNGVTHVVGLPDNDTAPLFALLEERAAPQERAAGPERAAPHEHAAPEEHAVPPEHPAPHKHTAPHLVRIAREGEAFALASGLWLGGATPAVVIQNTGLLESGDALRGTALRMGVPLVVVVGYRGFAKMRAAGRDPNGGPLTPEELMRADLDCVALMTEPTLMAWGVPYALLGGAADRPRVGEAFGHARRERRARALLLTHTLA